MAKFRVRELEWSEEFGPDDDCPYTHVFSITPFGRILVSWKGWKEVPDYTLDEAPWPESSGAWGSLEQAKHDIQVAYYNRVAQCLVVIPEVSNGGATDQHDDAQ